MKQPATPISSSDVRPAMSEKEYWEEYDAIHNAKDKDESEAKKRLAEIYKCRKPDKKCK